MCFFRSLLPSSGLLRRTNTRSMMDENVWLQSLNGRGASVSREFPESSIAVTIAAGLSRSVLVELSVRRAKRQLNAMAPQSAQKNRHTPSSDRPNRLPASTGPLDQVIEGSNSSLAEIGAKMHVTTDPEIALVLSFDVSHMSIVPFFSKQAVLVAAANAFHSGSIF